MAKSFDFEKIPIDMDLGDKEFWQYYEDQTGRTFPERQVRESLLTYWPPVFLFIGTLGNLISAVILWRLLRKVLSTCMYMFVAVCVDLIVLYIHCGNDWLTNMVDLNVQNIARHSSNSICKIFPFVSDWTLHLSMWLVASMAIETTMVTMKPQSLMRVCRLERGRAVILLIIVLLVCINAHNFWTFALTKVEKGVYEEEVCSNAEKGQHHLSAEFRKTAWPVIDILVADLLPICICFSCSVMLITRRIRMQEQLRQMENTWKAYSIDGSTAKQLQLAFLIIAICQVILIMPKLGCDIFAFLTHPDRKLIEYSAALDSRKELANAVCSICLYTFLSFKIVVFLIVSRTFRMEFICIVTCRFCNHDSPGVTNRVSTQQPLLSTVSNNTNSIDRNRCNDNCINSRKVFSTTSV